MNISYPVLLLVALSFSACGNHKKETSTMADQDTIPVKIMMLQMEDANHAIQSSGQFTTNDETFLSFKNGGIINKIYVKEGDPVHKGQLLASVNQTEISAQVQQVTLSYQKAQRDHDRASQLYRDSVATLEQMQNAKTALQVARQQLDAIKFNQNYSEIRATSNGYVLKKLANDGQVVGPGTPVLQINGANQSKWVLKIGLSDEQWASLKIGDRADITTDALPQAVLQAKVSRKAEGIDPQSGTFGVELTLDDANTKGLAAGLFGKATIIPTRTTSSYAIPYDALLDAGENEGYVFVTDDEKTAKKVKVKLGAVLKDKINISGGLENARALIISGSAYLTDGSKIRIVK
ncbi:MULTISPECIES: efflux RND transporter periplasmic adaptor subunit [unclassified Sphingobacterium]|uniref:efflux RND transporter periplasmic adaptor subunit n=1 Tax=unclassified Sphingobacterium TaxID=2609468 RepID=UPI0025EBF897|nr:MULTISPECIES: efflux RND transporter periplasmic adaptor subunit [unclassified Sphingobacterium]